MAKKKSGKNRKKTVDLKRILLLCFGSAAVISLLFMAGYIIDYAAVKISRIPPNDRFSIIEKSEKIDESIIKKNKDLSEKIENYSFFETLSKKENKTELDKKSEEELRIHNKKKWVKKTVEKPEKSEELEKSAKFSSVVYTAQLASFKSLAAAKAFRDKYITNGYPAYIVSADLPGKGTLHRVRIGRFKDIKAAQKFSTEFEKKEKVSVFITSK